MRSTMVYLLKRIAAIFQFAMHITGAVILFSVGADFFNKYAHNTEEKVLVLAAILYFMVYISWEPMRKLFFSDITKQREVMSSERSD